jgi:toxin ParE1/3/4
VTSANHLWKVRLSDAAEADFEAILLWTADRFGEEQAHLYKHILRSAIASLRDGPSIAGAKPRPDIAAGLHSLHAARERNRARHLVLFHIEGEMRIEIVRILHDSMDLQRHLTLDDEK